jgi:hypothetical protein
MCENSKKQGKPCRECPFNKKNVLGNTPAALGYSPVETYIGQAEGPFWLPCHMEKEYKGKETGFHDVGQCRGAAIYRGNLGISEKMPKQLLKLDKDTDTVFSNHVELLSFYKEWTPERSKSFLAAFPPMFHLVNELGKTEAKMMEI